MGNTRWMAVGMLLLAGCAAAGGAGDGETAPQVGEINADGEFVSQELGYAFRPPAGWQQRQTQVSGGITSVEFAPAGAEGDIVVSAGPPAADSREQLEDDTGQALTDISEQVAQDAGSGLDAESIRTIELGSGQPGVVTDAVASDEQRIRALLAYGNDLLYALRLRIGPELTDFTDEQADAVVASFRLLD